MNDILNQSIIKLKGIGSKTEEAFNKMGVYTICLLYTSDAADE